MMKLGIRISVLAAALLASAGASAQPSSSPPSTSATRFDGVWDTTVTCSGVDQNGNRVKGYVLQFPSEVKNGNLHGQYGTDDAPTRLKLEGSIESDGNARLVAQNFKNITGCICQSGCFGSYDKSGTKFLR